MKRDIEHRPGYLCVDCGEDDRARDISAIYRGFAVECVTKRINRVLVKTTDCSPASHYALRDALTVMLLNGIPSGFQLAMVTGAARVHAAFRELQSDLQRLSIHLALFDDEAQAVEWLQAGGPPPAATPQPRSARPQA